MNQKVPIHQLLYSTVRIEAKTKNGTSVGTGFIIEHKFEDAHYMFLVTNKHVVENTTEGSFFFTRANSDGEPSMGERFDVKADFSKVWHEHSTEDIVITPLLPLIYQITNVLKQRIYFKAIPSSIIPDKKQSDNLTALEEIIFIGYPNAIYDRKNLLPIIRKGTTATPLFVDYDGNPIFLIDASVFPGSSGSPVFIYNFGNFTDCNGNVTIGTRIHFVGVISKVLIKEEQGTLEFEEIPTSKVPVIKSSQMIDLGVVIKPRVIIETIEAFLTQIKPNLNKGWEKDNLKGDVKNDKEQ